jgi:hypothetical protein
MNIQQVKVCSAVASHFKIPAKQVREVGEQYINSTQDAEPALRLDLSAYCGAELNVGILKSTLALSAMPSFKHFQKSELYSEMLNLFENYEVELAVFLFGNKTQEQQLMCVRPARSYEGLGGIFCREASAKIGYVFELFSNYLKSNFDTYEV